MNRTSLSYNGGMAGDGPRSSVIVSIGEILWDIFPDSERLGGAPFNFAVHARRLGHPVIFLSAVGDDARGRRARERAAELGLPAEFIQIVPDTPTGTVTVQTDTAGQPDFTVHRPAAYDRFQLDPAILQKLAGAHPAWIYFGTLIQTGSAVHGQTLDLLREFHSARRIYDVNLRTGCYTPKLVRELRELADTIKLNEAEAREFPDLRLEPGFSAVAITRGAAGCEIRIGSDRAECPGYPVEVADTVGAGDAFAAAFVHGLDQGWNAATTGDFANRLGALVASRPGAIPDWSIDQLSVDQL